MWQSRGEGEVRKGRAPDAAETRQLERMEAAGLEEETRERAAFLPLWNKRSRWLWMQKFDAERFRWRVRRLASTPASGVIVQR